MVDATLGIAVQTKGVDAATESLARMSQAARGAEQATERLSSSARRASTSALEIAKGIGAYRLLEQVARKGAEAAKDFYNELAKLGDTARRVGVDVQRFQELQFAGGRTGLSGSDFASGIEKFAEKLNEARTEENSLSKLFDANNQKIKDREGNVIGVNEALLRTSELVRNAATELDKVRIAEQAGLTREWVSLLEKGPQEINRLAGEAQAAGGVLSREIVERARDFDRAWSQAWHTFTVGAKAALASIGQGIASLIGMAAQLAGAFGSIGARSDADILRQLNALKAGDRSANDLGLYGQPPATPGDRNLNRMMNTLSGRGVSGDSAANAETIRQLEAELELRNRNNVARARAMEIAARNAAPTGTTTLPPKGGGGGSSGESESALERQIRLLEERTKLEQEETRVIGLGTFERERRTAIQRLLNADMKDGGDLSKQFTSAEQLLAASSAELSPKLEEQRQKILGVASAYAQAQSNAEAAEDAQRRAAEVGSAISDSFKSLVSDAAKGKLSIDSLTSALGRLGDKFIDLAFDMLSPRRGGGGGILGLLSGLFGGGGAGGGGGFADMLGSLVGFNPFGGFALGGIMTSNGPLPLNRYASGGIANSPQMAIFGEGRKPEAYVPLPDGRSIPVTMDGAKGGMQSIQINFAPVIDNRGASMEAVARTDASLQKLKAELPSIVIKSVRDAQTTRKL